MDPITHGLLGGVTAQALQKNQEKTWLPLAGAIGAMLPDLDFLIRSKENPMLWMEYHRHFTHSLAFIPIGGFFTAFLFWLISQKRYSFSRVYIASTAGFATHSLLDACTTFGTVLLWPFSNQRFSWDIISIIDPVFSLILAAGLIVALMRKSSATARLCLVLALAYLSLGYLQHQRVFRLQEDLAKSRGQEIEHGRVYPSLGNLLLWRSLYISGDQIYIDALRPRIDGLPQIWIGGKVPRFQMEKISPPPPSDSTLRRDLQIFDWFSEGFLGELPTPTFILGDMRFSILPNGMEPLWGISFFPEQPNRHVQRIRFPLSRKEFFPIFWKMLWGKGDRPNI